MDDSESHFAPRGEIRSSIRPLTDAEVEGGLHLDERADLLHSLVEHQMIRQAQTDDEAVLQERLLRPQAEVEAELLRLGEEAGLLRLAERAGLLLSLVNHRMIRQAETEEEAVLWERLRDLFPDAEVLPPEALQAACSFPVLLPTWLPAGTILTASRVLPDQYVCGFTHDHGGHSSVIGFRRGSSLDAGNDSARHPLEGRRRPTFVSISQHSHFPMPHMGIRVVSDHTIVIIGTHQLEEEVALKIADSLEPVTDTAL